MRWQLVLILSVSTLLPVSRTVLAHEDTNAQMERLNRTLHAQNTPETASDTENLLRMAELQLRSGAPDIAMEYFNRVLEIDPADTLAMLGVAQSALSAGDTHTALRWSDRLTRQASHARASLVAARAHAGQQHHSRAEASYRLALATLQRPTPELYLEAAKAIGQIGNDDAIRRAITLLDEGARILGGLASIHGQAIEFELQIHEEASALARLERLVRAQPTLYEFRRRQSMILVDLGRFEEALITSRQLLADLERLPAHRKSSPAMRQLWKESQDDVLALMDSDVSR